MNLSEEKVKNLYYRKGLSARETAEHLGVSVWQIICFMKKNNFKRRPSAETQRLQFFRKPKSFKIKERLSKKEKELLVAGIMLYWAEGNKQKDTVDLANCDPRMIEVFLKFLREICQIDESRVRLLVYCYANQNVDELENFWSKITDVPRRQFFKTYVRKDYAEKKSGKMKYGLVHIRYSDQKLVAQIKKWIRDYSEMNIRQGTEADKPT